MAEYRVDVYQQMRDRIRDWLKEKDIQYRFADYLLSAPDLLHLLCRLSLDKEVPAKEKAKLAVAIAYFISPLDFIPEGYVGPIGYLEDIVLAAYALNGIINEINPDIVRKHWAGDGDVLELIRQILAVAHEMLGGRLWNRIRGIVDRTQ
jgi:uncharacterized membrane protein YkvA (DUF1232 family)